MVNAAALANQSITDISDLNKIVPAVSLNGSTNGRVPYAMRGVSTTADESNVGLESGVGIMVDGIPIPSDSHAAQQLVDVDNIQVLEGPQATLGGRTASAGLIDIVTRSPKPVFGGQVDGEVTTDNGYRGDVFVTGPIQPGWSASLSASYNKTPYPITNIYNDSKTHQDSEGARFKLEYKPDALLDATLTVHGNHSQSYGDNFTYSYISPGEPLLGAPPLSQAALIPGITPSYTNLKNNSIVTDAGAKIDDRDASLNISYQLGDLTLGSTTAYQSESERDVQDLFDVDQYFFNNLTHGAFSFDNNQSVYTHVHQTSQEFKVTSPAEDQFNYVAGLYYGNLDILGGTFRNGLFPATDDINAHPKTSTYDAYGRVTEKFTPQFSLVAGLRFNDDDLSVQQTQYQMNAYSPYVQANAHTNSGALVGDLSAKYNLDSRNMVYATYARGYAPGAYNTATAIGSYVGGGSDPFGPWYRASAQPLTQIGIASPVHRMDINHFEIGSKGRYFDGLLSVNADAFYTIYDNFQVETYASSAGDVNPPLVLTNAPEAQTHGVEDNATWRPTVNTTITASAAYIDATFVKYKDAECPYAAQSISGESNAQADAFAAAAVVGTACYVQPGTANLIQNVSGKPLPNSPKFKFNVNVEQRFPVDSLQSDLVLGATYTYRTSAQMLPDQNPYAVQAGFGLLNLNAGLQSNDGKYSVTIFANNVFNKIYYADVEDFWASPWGGGLVRSTSVVSQPGRDAQRYDGLRASVRF